MRIGVLAMALTALFAPARHPGFRPGTGKESPLELSGREWRGVLIGAAKEFMDDRVPNVAAGIAFYSLLALFPGITAFVALYGLFADPADVAGQVRVLAGLLPGDIVQFVGLEMARIAGGHKGGLGVTFAGGLLLAVWGANAGARALFGGLNVAYEVREHRGFLHLTLITLAFTAGGLIFVLLLAAASSLTPHSLVATLHPWLVSTLRIGVLLTAMVLGLALAYRYGPSRSHVRWRWVTPGSIVSIIAWVALSWAFSWYVGHFGNYERTYGSLAAAVGFMTWLWLSLMVLLFGAELNAEVELRTKGLPADETKPETAETRGR